MSNSPRFSHLRTHSEYSLLEGALRLKKLPDMCAKAGMPAMALTDGADGLSVYRIIAEQAQGYLTPKGRVLVEIGWQQGAAVQDIFTRAGWGQVTLAEDLDGRPRVICAGKPA